MGCSDGDRLVSGDGASGVSQRDKAVAPVGAIGVMEKAAMRTTNSEGWRTRQ